MNCLTRAKGDSTQIVAQCVVSDPRCQAGRLEIATRLRWKLGNHIRGGAAG